MGPGRELTELGVTDAADRWGEYASETLTVNILTLSVL